jgi:hypothetical protein
MLGTKSLRRLVRPEVDLQSDLLSVILIYSNSTGSLHFWNMLKLLSILRQFLKICTNSILTIRGACESSDVHVLRIAWNEIDYCFDLAVCLVVFIFETWTWM